MKQPARRRRLEKAARGGTQRWGALGDIRVLMLLPSVVAVTLSLPGLGFSWLWDDYDFLARVLTFRPSFLLPDPGSVFYRPVSREIYFGLVWLVGGGSALVGHLANAALLAAVLWLLTSFVARLTNVRTGVIAGLAFASIGAVPLLVTWVSGAQDLLAMLFALLALRFALSGKALPSACAMAAAFLSKETAIGILPIVAASPWILGRRPASWVKWLLPFAVVSSIWVAVHPAPRILLNGAGAESYVGIQPAGRGSFLASTLLTLVNLPPRGVSVEWLHGRASVGVIAALLLILAIHLTRTSSSRGKGPVPHQRVMWLAMLLALLPGLVTVALVRDWIPYYVAIPAIGASLLIAMAFERLPAVATALVLACFLMAGAWTRGAMPAPTVTCERNLEFSSSALLHVEEGFKRLRPQWPGASRAIVSSGVMGSLSVSAHLDRFQALRVWYRNGSIATFTPETRPAGVGNELLFRITPQLDVVEINTERVTYRSSGYQPPDPFEVDRTVRTYVRALARDGEIDQASRIQRELTRMDSRSMQAYDARIQAMFLLMADRRQEADSILARTPMYPRGLTMDMISKILMEMRSEQDLHVFRAFGIDSLDIEANGYIMHRLLGFGYRDQAAMLARHLLRAAPGDTVARAVLAEATRAKGDVRITSPVP